ncbi:MAG TPA: PAS domain-containing protein [Bradyrhizobium sp.]|uniref:PAS domain-containing protein n=1 Tax=Bradyrhizobium sp. TaxID=376 RepID=UPI002D80ACF0|nr:PAS domain-containing protein [Bradyrhizobium sp.]HET7887323.1 PAS domain-containing protein [Bradyrhizobium sp.]
MKHPSNQQFFAYWNEKRGEARAPDRGDFNPDAIRRLLGDIFVLACDEASGYPFRVAGTRLCALLGRDVKDQSFPALFGSDSRRDIKDIVTAVTEEMLPAVAGITAASAEGQAHLELLLLPFNHRAHVPLSMTGLLAPFETGHTRLKDFELTSWRYIHPPSERLVPRALRKLRLARGLMVYEGLR